MGMRNKQDVWIWFMVLIMGLAGLSGCSSGDNNHGIRNDEQVQAVTEFYTAAVSSEDILGRYAESADSTAPEQKDDAERKIEEADIIRIEGSYLYILNAYKGLIICNIANPDAPRITGRISVSGSPVDMYIRDQRAYIIVVEPMLYYGYIGIDSDSDYNGPRSRVDVINIANPAAPYLSGSYQLNGRVTDSRIVGDILYVVSTEEPYFWIMADGAKIAEHNADVSSQDNRNVYIASINVSAPSAMNIKHRIDFGGGAEYIHVTDQAIFITAGIYDGYGQHTMLSYIDISDSQGFIRKRGEIKVKGQVMDKFKLDYADGYLRVCTFNWVDKGLSHLFTIDVSNPDRLDQAGSLELGHGEQLFATRFDGNRAYMVTYERKDPLFVIDLSDPMQPEIKGELIVPGWSTHIEPRGDHLVALGVDDTDGSRVSVSLFDVADPTTPSLIKRLSFGNQDGWSASAAYFDVKAFTIEDELGLILLPYFFNTYTDGSYIIENRLQLIDYDNRNITARGWIKQKGEILRGRTHASRIFSVSGDELQVIDASDRDRPRITANLTLALNIVNFFPLSNGYGVQLIEYSGQYRLRCVSLANPAEGEPVSELNLAGSYSYPYLFANGNYLYLMTWVSPYHAYGIKEDSDDRIGIPPYPVSGTTTVSVYDFNAPAYPVKRGSVEVPGEFYSYIRANEPVLSSPFYGSSIVLQVKPDLLTFVNKPFYWWGYHITEPEPDDTTEKTLPDYTQQFEGFIQVDLSSPDHPRIASQYPAKLKHAESFFVHNDLVCYSVYQDAEPDQQQRSLVQYYLARLNIANPVEPVPMENINVPGTVLGMDNTGKYAYTINREWTQAENYRNTLNIVELKDDTAVLTGTLELDAEYYNFLITSDLIYTTGYLYRGRSMEISIIDVSNPQRPQLYQNVFAAGDIGFIGAKGKTAFISRVNGIACYSVNNPARPVESSFLPGASWAGNLTYSDRQAYISQGYYGLWAVNY